MIGVSVRTIHRRLSEYDLSIHSIYTDLTDSELDSIVSDVHKEFPMSGNKQMSCHLLSRGIRVQQHRIRESIRRVDPEGTMARRLNVIRYSVPAPSICNIKFCYLNAMSTQVAMDIIKFLVKLSPL
jgi:hypothetical protein